MAIDDLPLPVVNFLNAIGRAPDRRCQPEVTGPLVRVARGGESDAPGARCGLSPHSPSEPMLLMFYRCSPATSHTMSQISRSL